jgi:hypothetical protein
MHDDVLHAAEFRLEMALELRIAQRRIGRRDRNQRFGKLSDEADDDGTVKGDEHLEANCAGKWLGATCGDIKPLTPQSSAPVRGR